MKLAEWAKMYAALVGLIGTGVLGVQDMPLAWKLPLEIVVVLSGAFTTWAIPNKPEDPPPPPAPAWKSAGPAWEEPAAGEDDGLSMPNVVHVNFTPHSGYRLAA